MGQLLGNVAVGTVLKLNENGTSQNYIVVHQGKPSSMYDNSCNGTWLLRQNIYSNNYWSSDGSNFFNAWNKHINEYLATTCLKLFDKAIQSVIKTVKIPFCQGGRSSTVYSGAKGYECKVFLLSGYEVGWTQSTNAYYPVDGAKLAYFTSGSGGPANNKRIATYGGSSSFWWTRSPFTANSEKVLIVTDTGANSTYNADSSYGVRPAMVMPQGLVVDDSNNITSTQLPWPFPTVSSLTAPSLAMQQQTIPLSWTPVSVSGFDVTYQLQRNVNNGGWQNVGSPISQTSYTDTAQSGWAQVQYQVAPVIDGIMGSYTQSSTIPVSDPSALVISGSDGNLGTLTSNVPYTVSSNTGNPISLTRTVNGAQVVTLTVDSGFAYDIPIADLPTGTGTIQITASVEDTIQQIQTKTRTWTYYKTPINIPSTGGIAQLTQNGQNIWPVTVPDAVEAPVYFGGNLNAALNKLGQAALYTKIGSPKYNQVTVDLSKVKVGDEVLLPENGVMVSFVVGSLNYEPTLNTSGNRVLLIRKEAYQTGQWNSSNVNTYANSTVDTWLNGTYKNLLGQEVQDNIGTTTFNYTPGNGNVTVTNLSRSVFLLSLTELIGPYQPDANTEGNLLEKANDLLKVNETYQWTRTPRIYQNDTVDVFAIDSYDPFHYIIPSLSYGIRPCFTLPTTFNQTYYVDSSNNIHPSQEYTTGDSITDVFGYDVPIAQSESGTYVGTGTSGSSNPKSISLSFTPKFICITNQTDSSKRAFLPYRGYGVCWTQNTITTSYINTYGLATTWSANSVSWYSNSAVQQMNENGHTYQYTAFG